jgi:hypothetical protein
VVERSNPPTTLGFVPTQAMLDGDFTAFALAACQGSNKTLTGPFVGNKIAPSLINQQALNLLKFIPISTDPCGRIQYGILNNNREHQIIGRIDYQMSSNNTFYGRYFIGNYNNPVTWDGKNALLANKTGVADQAQSVVLGDTYIFSPHLVSSSHITVNRTRGFRVMVPYFSPKDLGINVYSPIDGFMGISVTGGLSIGTGGTNPGYFNSTSYQGAEDIDWIHGSHQVSVGVSYIRAIMNTANNRPTNGQFTFSGQITGLGYADFMSGNLSGFVQGNEVFDNDKSNYIGIYAQDSWKVHPGLQFNYGVRWEPFLPETNTNGYAQNFDINRFIAGTKSTSYPSAPAGLLFPGDSGFNGNSNVFKQMNQFAPRAGLIWDPKGDGRTTVRAAYGIFYDTPQLFFFTRVANNPPWGAQVSLTNPPGGFTDPYKGQPGGNPFPGGSFFPLAGVFVTAPLHMNAMYLQQWNLSFQRQVGSNLMLSATYLGNKGVHFYTATELNPAVYGPGATLANTNARRVLNQINPSEGQYYSTIGALDDGGIESYNGLLLSAQRRLANNFSILANYTWSHCLSDPETTELTGPTYLNPANRAADRSNCSSDRRRLFNLSAVGNAPKFSNKLVNALASNWQLSLILRTQTGNYSTITTGVDNAYTGVGAQRPIQINSNVFDGNPTVDHYLSAAAFGSPATGTYSTMRPLTILNPGTLQVDTALSRIFSIRGERQKIHFRWEVFNLPNHLNANAPGTALNNASTFGKITTAGDPRIMQLALKYVF